GHPHRRRSRLDQALTGPRTCFFVIFNKYKKPFLEFPSHATSDRAHRLGEIKTIVRVRSEIC
ncbi:hypothetical protein, partial [Acetobacter senegalensis]|uniref:hypothetical protein n=1 Tax=Acetobacter senegalensis TaxID=446692 RepID=UPI00264F3E89